MGDQPSMARSIDLVLVHRLSVQAPVLDSVAFDVVASLGVLPQTDLCRVTGDVVTDLVLMTPRCLAAEGMCTSTSSVGRARCRPVQLLSAGRSGDRHAPAWRDPRPWSFPLKHSTNLRVRRSRGRQGVSLDKSPETIMEPRRPWIGHLVVTISRMSTR